MAATTLRACDTVHTCLRQVFLADDLGDLCDPLDFLLIVGKSVKNSTDKTSREEIAQKQKFGIFLKKA